MRPKFLTKANLDLTRTKPRYLFILTPNNVKKGKSERVTKDDRMLKRLRFILVDRKF